VPGDSKISRGNWSFSTQPKPGEIHVNNTVKAQAASFPRSEKSYSRLLVSALASLLITREEG